MHVEGAQEYGHISNQMTGRQFLLQCVGHSSCPGPFGPPVLPRVCNTNWMHQRRVIRWKQGWESSGYWIDWRLSFDSDGIPEGRAQHGPASINGLWQGHKIWLDSLVVNITASNASGASLFFVGCMSHVRGFASKGKQHMSP